MRRGIKENRPKLGRLGSVVITRGLFYERYHLFPAPAGEVAQSARGVPSPAEEQTGRLSERESYSVRRGEITQRYSSIETLDSIPCVMIFLTSA